MCSLHSAAHPTGYALLTIRYKFFSPRGASEIKTAHMLHSYSYYGRLIQLAMWNKRISLIWIHTYSVHGNYSEFCTGRVPSSHAHSPNHCMHREPTTYPVRMRSADTQRCTQINATRPHCITHNRNHSSRRHGVSLFVSLHCYSDTSLEQIKR